jgi:predicted membrane protein
MKDLLIIMFWFGLAIVAGLGYVPDILSWLGIAMFSPYLALGLLVGIGVFNRNHDHH